MKPATATEVKERAQEMSELLGRTYGRLQSVLITPLLEHTIKRLKTEGKIP